MKNFSHILLNKIFLNHNCYRLFFHILNFHMLYSYKSISTLGGIRTHTLELRTLSHFRLCYEGMDEGVLHPPTSSRYLDFCTSSRIRTYVSPRYKLGALPLGYTRMRGALVSGLILPPLATFATVFEVILRPTHVKVPVRSIGFEPMIFPISAGCFCQLSYKRILSSDGCSSL